MLNNSSPAVSTFEEFETGPLPKAGWGGIPDVWFTSEIVSLARSLMIYDDLRSDPRSASDVTLMAKASHDLTVRRALSFEHIPVKGTGCLISLKFTPVVFDAAKDAHTLNGSSSDVGPERCVSCRMHSLLGPRSIVWPQAHTLNGSSSDGGPERRVSCRMHSLLGPRSIVWPQLRC
jgi:hypothetical protein